LRARITAVAIAAASIALTAVGSAAAADGNGAWSKLRATLSGYNEDPLALSTTGTGRFMARIDEQAQEITYTLSYSALEGNVTQSHIHLGGPSQSGGIIVFFCTNLGNGPAGTQACPPAPATITGTVRPADVIGPAGQGITAGQFDELIAAIRSGTTYVNVHSSLYPGGEIRAQVDHNH
jgi:hypothetical protein